jgi:predicted DNA-binding transcriptional regulator AlpA
MTHRATNKTAKTAAAPLATRKEVADHLGVPVATLHQWAYLGTGPRYMRVGRHTRYRWSEIERWLDAQTRGADPQGFPTRADRRQS